MRKVRHLTPDEEIALLDLVVDDEYIDYGSSRVTYYLEVEGKELAVKIFLDIQGATQVEHEVKMYEETDIPVTPIYAVGKRCIVTEWVEVLDYEAQEVLMRFDTWEKYKKEHDSYHEDENPEDVTYAITPEEFDACAMLMTEMATFTGGSNDDTQIGWSKELNRYVAYDFGYNKKLHSRDEQVGNMPDYVYDYHNVVQVAIEAIEYEEELWDCNADNNEDDDECNVDSMGTCTEE